MSKSARFGVVQVQFNDDGTLFIYQSDSGRVLSPELAQGLIDSLLVNSTLDQLERLGASLNAQSPAEPQSTVPAGVINTSDGPTELTDTEIEADKNAELGRARAAIARGVADVEAGRIKPVPSTPPKRRPGRPRKAQP